MSDQPKPRHRRLYLALVAIVGLAFAASGVVFSMFNAGAVTITAFGISTGFALFFLLMKANGWNPPPYQPPE